MMPTKDKNKLKEQRKRAWAKYYWKDPEKSRQRVRDYYKEHPQPRSGVDTRFKRQHQEWNFDNWDDVIPHGNGYMDVYLPSHPKADKHGYIPRHHAVWWMHTGQVIEKGYHLHHIDHDPSNDMFENLRLMIAFDHLSYHHYKPETHTSFTCPQCGEVFILPNYRVRHTTKKGYPPKNCSQQCAGVAKRGKELKRHVG